MDGWVDVWLGRWMGGWDTPMVQKALGVVDTKT